METFDTLDSAVAGAIEKIQADDSIKRNDSYSKFGQMETINLLPSGIPKEQVVDQRSCAESGDQNTTEENSSKDSKSASVSLSKYFEPNTKDGNSDAPAAFFFNLEKPDSGEQPIEKPKMSEESVHNDVSDQPTLQKFFAEDKSGNDMDGKAFFDKIALAADSLQVGGGEINTLNELGKSFKSGTIFSQPVITKESSDALPLEFNPTQTEIYEAWIPSAATQDVIKSVMEHPESFMPEKFNWTEPAIIIEEELEDPIKTLLLESNSPFATQRKVHSANDVLQNEDGLMKLIEADCYHAAINLTTRLLKSGYGIQHNLKTPKLLQLWFTRMALFVKLGKFPYAEVECEAFGNFDRPDLYFEFYPTVYPNRKGSMVPFSFRLLAAQLPQYQGNHQVSLNNLYAILLTIHKITFNLKKGFAEDGTSTEISEERKQTSLDLWKSREIKVLYAVLNCVLSQKDYVMAISLAQILLEKDTKHVVQLHSALGRIYLQLGDLKQAKLYFDKVSQDCGKQDQLEHLINYALLAVAHNDNKEAYKMYKQALDLQPNNPMLVNNVAVCLLYMGRLKDSLSLLEKAIHANPKACLHEGVLFNICTLYELESSHCTTKKQAMLNLVAKYAGDNLSVSCLKIPPNPK